MRVLELFSGTGSVGKICKEIGWEVISLDLKNADINTDILKWDYTQYPLGHFDLIWASPPCNTFSMLKNTHIGRKLKHHDGVLTKELIEDDIKNFGLPILRKTEEIIDYLKPTFYFIENPQTGSMKKYIDRPFYDVDYCKYADWGYKKRTRTWTNLKGFIPKLCKKDCGQIIYGLHRVNFGGGKCVIVDNKMIKITTKKLREKYKDMPNIQTKENSVSKLQDKYRIPPALIREIFDTCIKNHK